MEKLEWFGRNSGLPPACKVVCVVCVCLEIHAYVFETNVKEECLKNNSLKVRRADAPINAILY